MDNTKLGKERGISYWKNEKISGQNTHINTWTLNWNVLTNTDAFFNQKRVNVSLLIKEDICDDQNISVKLVCVYVCLSSRDLFIFRKSFLFLFLFLCSLLIGNRCFFYLFMVSYIYIVFSISCAILPVCSHTFILFWLRKISVSVETYQLIFCVLFWFICALHREISSLFW